MTENAFFESKVASFSFTPTKRDEVERDGRDERLGRREAAHAHGLHGREARVQKSEFGCASLFSFSPPRNDELTATLVQSSTSSSSKGKKAADPEEEIMLASIEARIIGVGSTKGIQNGASNLSCSRAKFTR